MNKIPNSSMCLKKIIRSIDIDDYEIMTDDGWVDVTKLHETIPYQVYELKLSSGESMRCADNHILFNERMDEVFVKDLIIGDKIVVNDKKVSQVTSIADLGYKEKCLQDS